ncbi:MAG: hypothetical protein OJF58_001095 [Enhydrobacter sp.]|nr:MAG: hypothetical protein OJF58_001095 [Enhydrobacter sp.]
MPSPPEMPFGKGTEARRRQRNLDGVVDDQIIEIGIVCK